MLLKTKGEKMSLFRFSAMLLKRSKLMAERHDVVGKKGVGI
jgi:hypothetical protein